MLSDRAPKAGMGGQTGLSVAELVRRAIDQYLEKIEYVEKTDMVIDEFTERHPKSSRQEVLAHFAKAKTIIEKGGERVNFGKATKVAKFEKKADSRWLKRQDKKNKGGSKGQCPNV